MNWLRKIFELIPKQYFFARNVFILVIITRLLFLEDNQLALIAEIIGGIIMLTLQDKEKDLED